MTERIGKIRSRAVILPVFWIIGMILLGGCGQKGAAEAPENAGQEGAEIQEGEIQEREEIQEGQEIQEAQEMQAPEQNEEIPAGRQEENSLERWKASLPEGLPKELTAKNLRGVSVVREGVPYFAVSYEPRVYKNSFDCWAISEPYQSMAAVDTEAMYEYFQILADMELTPVDDITREEAGTEEASDTVFAAYYSGQTEAGGQAEPDRGITYYFGSQDEAGDYYVEAGGQLWLVDQDTAERLFAADPYDCILKVISVVSVETVSKVTIEFADKRYEMQLDGGTFQWNGRNVDSAELYELYAELMSVFIEKELPREEQGNTEAVGRELLMRVVYERNMEDAPAVIQNYYAYDDLYASVQVNGTEFFLVRREALQQLQRRIEDAF